MVELLRSKTTFSGGPGGPGVATMYTLDVDTWIARLHDFWTAIALGMPNDYTITVENSGDKIDEATGNLTGTWTDIGAATPPIVGGSGENYAAPAGICIGWDTATILDSHRLRGRTFVVPTGQGVFDTDGTIFPTALTNFKAAAAAFVTSQSSSFVVWHRPFAGAPAVGAKPARPAHPGGHGLVVGSHIRDKVAVLRSRRD